MTNILSVSNNKSGIEKTVAHNGMGVGRTEVPQMYIGWLYNS